MTEADKKMIAEIQREIDGYHTSLHATMKLKLSRLLGLLVEERAKVICYQDSSGSGGVSFVLLAQKMKEHYRAQARRELGMEE